MRARGGVIDWKVNYSQYKAGVGKEQEGRSNVGTVTKRIIMYYGHFLFYFVMFIHFRL